jgi:hypothetical protein
VGSLRAVALPALSIVGPGVKSILITLVLGSLVVTIVPVVTVVTISAPAILAVATVVAISTAAVNVIAAAIIVVAVPTAAVTPVIAVSMAIISIPIPISVLPILSPSILRLCRRTRNYSDTKQKRNCQQDSSDSFSASI